MKRISILLSMKLIIISLLVGCWSKKEMNELSIITAMGIDKTEEGYLVTIQLINPGEVASEQTTDRTAVTVYNTTGETVFEALRRLTLETPRKIYNGHLRLLVFGEDMAKHGIGKVLDFFSRDHEFRTDFYIVVSKNIRAEKFLNVLTPVERIPADKIFSSLEVSENTWAPTYNVQLDDLIRSIVSDGKNPVLTGVFIKGDPEIGMNRSNLEQVNPPASIQISYLAGFKNDKLVGWFNEEESIGYNYIMDHVKSTVITVHCSKDGKLAVEIIRSKANVYGIVENEKPKINVEIWGEGYIGDVECDIDLSKTDNIYEIEKKIEEIVKSEIKAAISKAQESFKSDIFGFGEAIHRGNPKAWKNLKEDWDNEFEHLDVNIEVDIKIRRQGTIIESFQKEIEE